MSDKIKTEEIHMTTKPAGLAEYSPFEAEITNLGEELKDKVYDLDTGKGLAEAKADKTRWVKIRTGLEKIRKVLKGDLLATGKRIDAEAKRLTALATVHEAALADKIKAREDQKRVEKEERERLAAVERARQEQIQCDIGHISKPLKFGSTLADAKKRQQWLESKIVTEEEFGARMEEAQDQLILARDTIFAIVNDLETKEQERQELEALRKKQAEEEAAKEQPGMEAGPPAPSPEAADPTGEPEQQDDGAAVPDNETTGEAPLGWVDDNEQARALAAAADFNRGGPPIVGQSRVGSPHEPAGPVTQQPMSKRLQAPAKDIQAQANCFMAVRRSEDGGRWLDVATASTHEEWSTRKANLLDIHLQKQGTKADPYTVVRVVVTEEA